MVTENYDVWCYVDDIYLHQAWAILWFLLANDIGFLGNEYWSQCLSFLLAYQVVGCMFRIAAFILNEYAWLFSSCIHHQAMMTLYLSLRSKNHSWLNSKLLVYFKVDVVWVCCSFRLAGSLRLLFFLNSLSTDGSSTIFSKC